MSETCGSASSGHSAGSRSDRGTPPGWICHACAGLCASGFAAICLGLTTLVLGLAVTFLAAALYAHLRFGMRPKLLPPSLVGLAVWALLGSAFSMWPQQSLGWWAIGLAVLLTAWQVATFPWCLPQTRFLACAVVCCGAVLGGYAVAQFAVTGAEASGRMTQPNGLAAFILLVWPLGYTWGRAQSGRVLKAGGLAASGLMLAALAVTFSRAGWFGAIAQAFYVFRHRRMRVLVGLLVAAVIMCAVLPWEMGGVVRTLVPGYRTNVSRLSEWATALRLVADEPVWGIGVGTYSVAAGTRSLVPHNLFLHVAAQTGLVGLCLFVASLGSVWDSLAKRASGGRSVWASAARIAVVGLLVQALFDY